MLNFFAGIANVLAVNANVIIASALIGTILIALTASINRINQNRREYEEAAGGMGLHRPRVLVNEVLKSPPSSDILVLTAEVQSLKAFPWIGIQA